MRRTPPSVVASCPCSRRIAGPATWTTSAQSPICVAAAVAEVSKRRFSNFERGHELECPRRRRHGHREVRFGHWQPRSTGSRQATMVNRPSRPPRPLRSRAPWPRSRVPHWPTRMQREACRCRRSHGRSRPELVGSGQGAERRCPSLRLQEPSSRAPPSPGKRPRSGRRDGPEAPPRQRLPHPSVSARGRGHLGGAPPLRRATRPLGIRGAGAHPAEPAPAQPPHASRADLRPAERGGRQQRHHQVEIAFVEGEGYAATTLSPSRAIRLPAHDFAGPMQLVVERRTCSAK